MIEKDRVDGVTNGGTEEVYRAFLREPLPTPEETANEVETGFMANYENDPALVWYKFPQETTIAAFSMRVGREKVQLR